MAVFTLLTALTALATLVAAVNRQSGSPGSSGFLQLHSERGKRVPEEKPSIVYGVMSTGSQPYRDKLTSQVQTWAMGLVEQRRFFSVAGIGAPAMPAAGLIIEDGCPDESGGIACKEGRLMEEGYDRGAEWLVILGEDNYVNTSGMEEELNKRAAMTQAAGPLVLGIVGCGENLGYCPEVSELGGLCGGGGYAVNRAALEALMVQGRDALRHDYRSIYRTFPGDMASACAFRRHGVRFENLPGLLGNRIEKAVDFRNTISGRFLVVHYCTPEVMRWVYSVMQDKPDTEVESLQAAAFDGGCCCAWGASGLQKCKEEVAESAAALLVSDKPPAARARHVRGLLEGPPDFDQLRLAYIEERNSQLKGSA